jgi:preprotein translocase subunit Sss1
MGRCTDAHGGLEVEQYLLEDVVVRSVHDRQVKPAVGLLGSQAALGRTVCLESCLQRKKSKNYLLHLVVPTLGFLIIGYVLFNADSLAKIGGIVWLAIGAVVFIVNKLRGRAVPQLAEERAQATALQS